MAHLRATPVTPSVAETSTTLTAIGCYADRVAKESISFGVRGLRGKRF